jgi:two-component system cell cycle sensor histidine kinase/response regulator CckA
MNDEHKTKKELVAELAEMRQRVAALEASEARLKQVEKALKIKEHAIASSMNAIAIADLAGNLMYVNDAWLELYGYDEAKQAVGRSIESCFSDKGKALAALGTLRAGESWEGELTAQRDGGSLFDMYITASIVKDEAGEPLCIIASSIDVTERKRAEEALRESEERFRSFAENAATLVCEVDLEGQYLYVNPAFQIHLGYQPEELIGRLAGSLVHPDELAEAVEKFGTLLETDTPSSDIWRFRHKNGEWRWFHCCGNPFYTADGEKRIVVISTNITERVRAEEALRESEEKYRTFVERANDGIAIVQDELIKYANPRLAKIGGYTIEEIMGTPFTRYIHPDDLSQVTDRYKRRIAGEEVTPIYESALKHKDGHKVYVEFNVGLITYQGKPAELVIVRDITERKQMGEQLRQHERLAAIGQLAGGIAHDFNNLLATIILYAQMALVQCNISPDVTQACETILAESQRAAKLVQQILDFSRSSMMATRPLDLASFNERVFDVLRRTIPENVRLILAMGPENYIVEADPTRIQQVLINLALNARDAMPEGGTLRVGLSRVTVKSGAEPPATALRVPPGEWVCLTISDTGMGMTEEVQDHLFEPFFTTKEPGVGTGLGLAQVYGIVKQHSGHIDVETAVGEGTAFRIYLSAYEEEVEKRKAKESSALLQGKGEMILVVEDEIRLRKAMEEVLMSLGYQVLTAANGQEALEIYRSLEEVNLLLVDLVMPEMGGKQLIRELKKENLDFKALAITGYVMNVDPQELKEAGFLGIVSKPFDTNSLAQTLRRVLSTD